MPVERSSAQRDRFKVSDGSLRARIRKAMSSVSCSPTNRLSSRTSLRAWRRRVSVFVSRSESRDGDAGTSDAEEFFLMHQPHANADNTGKPLDLRNGVPRSGRD